MLEMKVVLRAVLSRAEVRSGLEGPELTRRRSITVSPRHGAVTALRERASVRRLSPTRTPAAPRPRRARGRRTPSRRSS